MNVQEKQRYYWKAYNTGYANGYYKGFKAGINHNRTPVKGDRFPGNYCIVCGEKIIMRPRPTLIFVNRPNSSMRERVWVRRPPRSHKVYCSRACTQWAYRKRKLCMEDGV